VRLVTLFDLQTANGMDVPVTGEYHVDRLTTGSSAIHPISISLTCAGVAALVNTVNERVAVWDTVVIPPGDVEPETLNFDWRFSQYVYVNAIMVRLIRIVFQGL
jgi:hypothetical protein